MRSRLTAKELSVCGSATTITSYLQLAKMVLSSSTTSRIEILVED
jgi:hypothetical protein